MEKQPSDLFNIQIDPGGAESIRKLYRLTRILLAMVFVSTAIMAATIVVETFNSHPERYAAMPFLYFTVKYRVWYMTAYLGLFVYQWTFFYQFTKKSAGSLDNLDSDLFNRSLASLYRGSLLAVVNFVIGIGIATLSLLVALEFASRSRG